jgi:hypothetical protein
VGKLHRHVAANALALISREKLQLAVFVFGITISPPTGRTMLSSLHCPWICRVQRCDN